MKIVDAGSISRAATTTFVAQPALSLQIAELEAELGMALLHRSARGVRPTQAGELLYREATQILRRVERLPELLRAGAGEVGGSVRLGIASTLAAVLAGDFVAYCKTQLPKVTLTLVAEDSASIRSKLLGHALDLGIVFDPETTTAGLTRDMLFRQRLFLVDRAPLPWRADGVRLNQLADTPLVLPAHGNSLRALIEAQFARAGLMPVVAVEANVLSSIASAVLSGVGASIVPLGEFAGTAWQDSLAAVPIKPPIYQIACSTWAVDADFNSAGEAVRALLGPFTRQVMQRKAKAGMTPMENGEEA